MGADLQSAGFSHSPTFQYGARYPRFHLTRANMSFRRFVPKVGLEPTSREALVPKTSVYTIPPLWQFAPRDGFEPTTTRLTVEGSTAELSRIM